MEQETVVTEPVTETVEETVSTEQVQEPEVIEFKAPATQEELDSILKAEANRVYTKALKELGVNSVKEFKLAQAKLAEDQTNIDTIKEQNNTYANEVKELEGKYNSLAQESVLDKLSVSEDWRVEITKEALANVTEEKTFQQAVEEMTSGKWSHVIESKAPLRLGSEKKSVSEQEKYNSEMERLRNL